MDNRGHQRQQISHGYKLNTSQRKTREFEECGRIFNFNIKNLPKTRQSLRTNSADNIVFFASRLEVVPINNSAYSGFNSGLTNNAKYWF